MDKINGSVDPCFTGLSIRFSPYGFCFPDWCIAAGNPCKVLRKITENDKRKLYRNEEIDDEAWKNICECN